jgi:hypothetical protein
MIYSKQHYIEEVDYFQMLFPFVQHPTYLYFRWQYQTSKYPILNDVMNKPNECVFKKRKEGNLCNFN